MLITTYVSINIEIVQIKSVLCSLNVVSQVIYKRHISQKYSGNTFFTSTGHMTYLITWCSIRGQRYFYL